MSDSLIFSEHPDVYLASNRFIQVPIILQYENTPLIEVIKQQDAGYTTQYSIYHEDGTYLAKAKGSRLFLTKDGEKAGLLLQHHAGVTACELNGQTLFEIRREEASAVKTHAEIWTQNGKFIKTNDAGFKMYEDSKALNELRIGGLTLKNSTIARCRVGIQIDKNGFRLGAG